MSGSGGHFNTNSRQPSPPRAHALILALKPQCFSAEVKRMEDLKENRAAETPAFCKTTFQERRK